MYVYTYNANERWDGFGAQYQDMIYDILYTRLVLDGVFAYTSPNFHVVYGEDASNIEDIMNLQSVYRNAREYDIVHTFPMKDAYNFVDANITSCINSWVMDEIRRAFHLKHAEKYKGYWDRNNDVVTVAVHIRRPSNNHNVDIPDHLNGHDVKAMNMEQFTKVTGRFTSNDRYLEAMEAIRKKHKRCVFHIVSEGTPDMFECFKADDVYLHLNNSVEDSFCRLVYSDILVISCSSFSYTAALIQNKEVWYQPFWHPPASGWIAF